MLSENVIGEIRGVVGPDGVLASEEDLLTYECAGITIFKGTPDAIVLPRTTEQVMEIVNLCVREKAIFVPRGAGTGLSGGAEPVQGGIIVSLSRMGRILEVDYENQRAVVEPGVVNLWLTERIASRGFYYAPDPASQQACTLGGNVGHNAGGPHCLKYGVTSNHVLGLEIVLPSGGVIQTGGKSLDAPGYDLTGLMVGSEGTLGIVTQLVLRIMRKPEAVTTFLSIFDSVSDTSNTVSGIIAAGIIPAAIEFMDHLSVAAVEASPIHAAGYPTDAEAVLLIEIDGLREEVAEFTESAIQICKKNGAREVRIAKSEEERKKLWQGRKGAFGAMGALSPNAVLQDSVVPRKKLPEILAKVFETAKKYDLRIANVFHAGDGNLHPIILFDARIAGELEKAVEASVEIVKACVEAGGTLTGEHGIGIEKKELMPLVFSEVDLQAMRKVKEIFNPSGLCNPGKIFPSGSGCVGYSAGEGKLVGW